MWRIAPNLGALLDRRDKIEAISIERDEDWAAAFRQLAECLKQPENHIPPPPDPFAYDRQQYFARVQARHGVANLQGLYVWGAGYAREDVLLGEVFVEPDLEVKEVIGRSGEGTIEPLADLSLRTARGERGKDGRKDAIHRERSSQVIAREGHLLIVGSPGQGKSTLLKHWLLEATAPWWEKPAATPFPVFVRLSDWEIEGGSSDGRLLRHIESRLPQLGEIGSKAVAEWSKGPILWLLDGIDEIRDQFERGRFIEEVRATSAMRPQDRWVVATRPAGEPHGGLGAGWTRAVLPSLSDAQVEQVLARWSAVLEKKEGLRLDAQRLARDLRKDPGLRQVCTNALLLTLAVLFFKSRMRLPHHRWEFYDGAEKALWDAWVNYRIRFAEQHRPGDYLADLLERLSLSGMESGHVLFDRALLKQEAQKVLAERGYTGQEQDEEIGRFLRAAEDLIGVLVEQGPDRFGFLHLTFQEFYAARALVHRSGDAAGYIKRYWDHPGWREVWPLYALGVQNDRDRYAALFETILANRHPLDEQLFRPQLACLRLAGLGSAPMPPSVTSIVQWEVEALGGDDWWLLEVMCVLVGWERAVPEEARQKLLARLANGDDKVGYAAAQALAGAAGAAEVRQALLDRLGDNHWGVRRAAARALAEAAGEADVRQALLDRLGDDNWSVRYAAAQALAGAAGDAEVREALLARLRDDDSSTVRREAVEALAGVAGRAEVRTALLDGLADKDCVVRRAAVRALARAAGETKVRKALLARLDDHDWNVLRAAVRALAGSAGDAEVREALLARLGDNSSRVRWAAVRVLAGAAREAKVREALRRRLDDGHWGVRRAAVEALAGAAGDAEVREALLARLRDDHPLVRHAAVKALAGAVGHRRVGDALLARLTDNVWEVRSAAIQALAGAVGHREVREVLLSQLADGNVDVRLAAVRALTGAVNDHHDVRKALRVRLTADDHWAVRGWAVRALAGAAADAEVRTALLARLGDDYWGVRRWAVQALAGAVNDQEVREALRARLAADDHWAVRSAVVAALAEAVGAREVREALLARLAEDEDFDVRWAAVRTLARAVNDHEVREALLARLRDDHWEVCWAAVRALGAGILAEKFGLPAGETDVVYP